MHDPNEHPRLAVTNSLYDRFRRLWGVRHIRFYRAYAKVDAWVLGWYRMGIGMGHINPSDIEWLERIRDGKA